MSDILGYDIEGKPVRAGDRVRIMAVSHPEAKYLEGQECSVLGPAAYITPFQNIQIDAPDPRSLSGYWNALSERHLRINEPQAGDWSEIEKQTGWKPRIEVEA